MLRVIGCRGCRESRNMRHKHVTLRARVDLSSETCDSCVVFDTRLSNILWPLDKPLHTLLSTVRSVRDGPYYTLLSD